LGYICPDRQGSLAETKTKADIVIVVDDGVATGATTMATLRALGKQEPKELILAIPVGPPDTVKQLGQEADRVICLSTPRLFWAVGAF